ncbi:hypothetical protein [Flavobacterium sp.]|uniref:hypothetical protein n=1 Tax=Flavobacterium sp. TaxID=239 RepID=UPI0037BD1011
MVQTIKKIGFAVLFTALTVVTTQAQTTQKLKKHQCTEACANGKHVYKHGEKKHKCDASCKSMGNTKMELKDHVCTSACKDGNHMYAHGEKGHVCDAKCKM